MAKKNIGFRVKRETQADKIKRAARELGADVDEAVFDRALEQIVSPRQKKRRD